MRILVTGATGFIGSALVGALRARGHEVVRAMRHPREAGDLQADFASVPSRDWWQARLQGFDAVVNAVGILREGPAQAFDTLHARAPVELFHGAAAAGVATIIQVSALGASAGATSAYHRSKHVADAALAALPLRGAVVQPSLVYGEHGASAALFERMAVAPLLPLPAGGRMQVQPAHLDDLVAAIVALVERPPEGVPTLAFAGVRPVSLRDYLETLRRALGEPGPLRVVPVPAWLFRATAAVAGRLPGSLLDGETAGMLLAGNATHDNALPRWLGHMPREARAFVAPGQAEARRRNAALDLWLLVLRASLAFLWVWTGLVSLGLYPLEDSLRLLARVGLYGGIAWRALYGAALLDVALGVLTFATPPPWRRALWKAQLVLIGGYTLLITRFLPEFWLHPYGPLSKNLPILAAIALLWALEPPRARKED